MMSSHKALVEDTEFDPEEFQQQMNDDVPIMLAVADGPLSPEECSLSSITKLGGIPTVMKGGGLPVSPTTKGKKATSSSSSSTITPTYMETVTAAMDRTCGRCKKPMFLISQCYCPIPFDEAKKLASSKSTDSEFAVAFAQEVEIWNRMMYVFGCNAATCAAHPEEGTWKAFSVLIKEEDPAEDDEGPSSSSSGNIPFCFPPVALAVDEEPEKESTEPVSAEERKLFALAEKARKEMEAKQAAEAASASAGDKSDSDSEGKSNEQKDLQELDEKIDLRNKDTDVAFEEFRSRMARDPKQALRYARGGQPLFMNPWHFDEVVEADRKKRGATTTAPSASETKGKKCLTCTKCSTPLTMELQVMPTAVYFLNVSQHTQLVGGGEGLDFGTLTVFICPNLECEKNLVQESARSQRNRIGHEEGSSKLLLPELVVVQEEVLFVEPAPSMEHEKKARGEGKQSFGQFMSSSTQGDGGNSSGEEGSPGVPPLN